MSQPEWIKVGTLGDINPIDYDGGFVFEDTTGVYPPEVEYYVRDSDDDDSKIRVYRFIVEPCTFINGVLSDNPYHKDHAVWFADSLTALASFCGIDELVQMFCSPDTMTRAHAWLEVGLYWGFNELDDYPLVLTYTEAEARINRQ